MVVMAIKRHPAMSANSETPPDVSERDIWKSMLRYENLLGARALTADI